MEFVGRAVRKEFLGFGMFSGTIQSLDPSSGFFYILYEDGDSEEVDLAELKTLLEGMIVEKCSAEFDVNGGRLSNPREEHGDDEQYNKEDQEQGDEAVPRLNLKYVEKFGAHHSHDSNAGGSGDSSNMTFEGERGTCKPCLNPVFNDKTNINVKNMDEHSIRYMVDESTLTCEPDNVINVNRDSINSSRVLEASASDASVISISKCSMGGTPSDFEKDYETGTPYKQGSPTSRKRQKLEADAGIISLRKGSSATSTPHNAIIEVAPHVGIASDIQYSEGSVGEFPPKVGFPPSSKNLDLEDIPVLDFFSVYSFLISFSNVLFLSPFKLEDFMGAVKCKSPTTLFNSIHVSLLQTLKKHLECVSADGCEASSIFLRDVRWDLMDMITWPLFMVHYMLHSHGFKNRFDASFFSVLHGDYYRQSAAMKIRMLLYLCDESLETRSIRSEINKRCFTSDYDMDFDRSANSEIIKIKKDGIDVLGSECLMDEDRNGIGDLNSDECCLCRMDGTLICCDGCPAAYHMKCVGVSEDILPNGQWYCPECVVGRYNQMNQKLLLRVADLLGIDIDGYRYFSCCEYLLVCHSITSDSSYHYYHRNDLNIFIQVLKTSHKRYEDIISAISTHWNISTNSCPTDISLGSHALIDQKNTVESSLQSINSSNLLNASDITAVKMDIKAQSEDSQTSSNRICPNKEIPNIQFFYSRRDKNTIPNRAESTCLHATPTVATHALDDQSVHNYTCDYVNSYGFAQIASTISEELFHKSLEKVNKDVSGSIDDVISSQMKAVVKTSSAFYWKRFRNLNDNTWKEKCGWCLPCKASDGDQDCLFKKVVPVIENYRVMCSQLKRCEEGHLADVIHHILFIEDRLRGLLSGPWLNSHYTKIWHKSGLTVPSLISAKRMLLVLELNIHHLAFYDDWSKHVDSSFTMGPSCSNVDSSIITSPKQISRRRSIISDIGPNLSTPSGFFWWRGGGLSRHLFNRKILPRSMISKAARQAGHVKIPGVLYSDNSDLTKYNKQIAWRAAVETSTSVEKLALQVRELNMQIKWDEIENTHVFCISDKEFKNSIRSFKKASIRKKSTLGTAVKYLIDFGKRKLIPDSVLKNASFLQTQSDNKKMCWMEESHVPLHLIKAFEERLILINSTKLGVPKDFKKSKVSSRKKDLSYLLTKAERPQNFDCHYCKMVLTISEAVRCQYCEGLFHRRHARKFTKDKSASPAKYVYVCDICMSERHEQDRQVSRNGRKQSNYRKRLIGTKEGKKQRRKSKQGCLNLTGRKRGRPRKSRLSNVINIYKKKRKEKLRTYWLNGLLYSGKAEDERVIDFRRKNSAALSPAHPPSCCLCLTSGSDNYAEADDGSRILIRCLLCGDWFHGKAFGVRVENMEKVIGFRCHGCRKKTSPICFGEESHGDRHGGDPTPLKP